MHPILTLLATAAALTLGFTTAAPAAALLEYKTVENQRSVPQPILVQAGTALLKAVGGDTDMDVLWHRSGERLTLIDHRKRRYMPISPEGIDRIAARLDELRPLLRGLSDQLQKLNPRQRARWESMLEGIPLELLSARRAAAPTVRVEKARTPGQVAGAPCESVRISRGDGRTWDACLAKPGDLHLDADDAATLESLMGFARKLATRAAALNLPLDVPAETLAAELTGLPVEIRESGGRRPRALLLDRIAPAPPGPLPEIPEGYQARPLSLW